MWHVIQIYAAQGLRRFVLCTGYKGELIEEFVASREWPAGVEVRCVDTGADTPTGGRIRQAGELLGERSFCATYADGVADIDIEQLIEAHRAHGDLATRYGRPARASVRHRRAGRARPDQRLPREAAQRALGQRRVLLLRARRARLRRRGLGPRARAARAPGLGGAAPRLSPRGLLGVHGHVQGRRHAERHLGGRRSSLEGLGLSRLGQRFGLWLAAIVALGRGPAGGPDAADRALAAWHLQRRGVLLHARPAGGRRQGLHPPGRVPRDGLSIPTAERAPLFTALVAGLYKLGFSGGDGRLRRRCSRAAPRSPRWGCSGGGWPARGRGCWPPGWPRSTPR